MSEAKTIKETPDTPATVASLTAEFQELGITPGMVLLVHSSLSKLGWVCGGEVAVIQALIEVLGPDGTLVMPTHTAHYSDPGEWKNPPTPQAWWQIIKDNMPAYDPAITPSREMGAIAECFRRFHGVIRSSHPHTSFAALGPMAHRVIDNHSLDFCLGEGSPLARLYDLDASILLIGVGHTNNTSMHLAEYRANYREKHTLEYGAPVKVHGRRKWVTFKDINHLDDSDFEDIGRAFAKESDLVKAGKIAQAETLLLPQRPLIDYAVKHMEQHRK